MTSFGLGAPAALIAIAKAVGRVAQSQSFLAGFEALLDRLAAKASGRRLRPVYLVTPLLDGRHVVVYGASSLFQEVMLKAGLRNAFTGATSPRSVTCWPAIIRRCRRSPSSSITCPPMPKVTSSYRFPRRPGSRPCASFRA